MSQVSNSYACLKFQLSLKKAIDYYWCPLQKTIFEFEFFWQFSSTSENKGSNQRPGRGVVIWRELEVENITSCFFPMIPYEWFLMPLGPEILLFSMDPFWICLYCEYSNRRPLVLLGYLHPSIWFEPFSMENEW